MRRSNPGIRVSMCTAAIVFALAGTMFSGCGESRETKTRPRAVGGKIALPAPRTEDGMPLNEALKRRRSQRGFSDRGLTLEYISQLLWAAQGAVSYTHLRAHETR